MSFWEANGINGFMVEKMLKSPIGGGEGEKNAVSPFVDASGTKILVLLSVSVERFGVSRMRDFVLCFIGAHRNLLCFIELFCI